MTGLLQSNMCHAKSDWMHKKVPSISLWLIAPRNPMRI